MIKVSSEGLRCEPGDFHIDPWRVVPRAVITHAHADHARSGCGEYWCASTGAELLATRLGPQAKIHGIPFGQRFAFGPVAVSFHPAGHVLGSAQIRMEHQGEVWVVTGDFKTSPDPSSETFEAVPCDTLIMESTFALPVYRWPDPESVFREINDWWRDNAARDRTSVLFAYALGKAQRVLCGIDPSIGPVGVHGAVEKLNACYRAAGKPLPGTVRAGPETRDLLRGRGLIIAPGSTQNTPWLRRFDPCSTAFASGWMRIRGNRRRRALDRGFVLSDHADWPGLIETIRRSGARRVGVTHGYSEVLVDWVREEMGVETFSLPTRFTGERENEAEPGGEGAE